MASEKDSSYYDKVYSQIINTKNSLGAQWIQERNEGILPYIKGSVLDIGCGLGEICKLLSNDNYYIGVDFSRLAIDYARRNAKSAMTTFICNSFEEFSAQRVKADTVLLLEVLEHMSDRMPVTLLARRCAKKRVIITVPRDMPGRAHVKPRWNQKDIENLFGNLSVCKLFGGENQDRWWIAIKDMA